MARRTDPILNHRFILELGFLQVAGFAECTGLALETKIFEYKEGGRNSSALKFPEMGAVSNVVLKRGIVPGPYADTLLRWQLDVMHGDFDATNNPNRRKPSPDDDIDQRCTIVLQNGSREEVKRWRLIRAIPVKWTGPDLKAMSNDVALETLELAHEGLELG